MTIPLVVTKIEIPPLRENRVLRPRLLAQLNAGLDRPLTLISSPAGFGKTTLLSEFAFECERPVAWFSIDEQDDDSQLFLSYMIASLEQLQKGFGEAFYPLLLTPKPERIETLLAVVINEINAEFPPLVLVFDDYHLISSPEIHQAMTYLIEHLPTQMHLVIATRADPPFPLSRLRVRAQLSEIREKDLRFTAGEAEAFLNQVMDLDLEADQIGALERRTEGWAAGLQLAADLHSIQGGSADRYWFRLTKRMFIGTMIMSRRVVGFHRGVSYGGCRGSEAAWKLPKLAFGGKKG